MADYHRDTTEWGTANGEQILIKDLTTPHLVNILNWISRNNQQRWRYPQSLIDFLEEEAALRKFTGFMENEPIPEKREDGVWVLTNISRWALAKSLFYKYKTEFKLWHQKYKERGKLLIFKRLKDRIIYTKLLILNKIKVKD